MRTESLALQDCSSQNSGDPPHAGTDACPRGDRFGADDLRAGSIPGDSVMKTIRIGCGAGYSGDRLEPAVELAEKGRLDYLIFECLAERTIALAQLDLRQNPEGGFDQWLRERMEAVLPICWKNGTRIVSNMGAANPAAAARATLSIARSLGLHGLKVAYVTGDNVLPFAASLLEPAAADGPIPDGWQEHLLSANAYLGAEPITQALAQEADVVLTGRTADPSLFLGPLMHEFAWQADDWPQLGQGTLVGHLLECAGQITGGYFADAGYKDVPDLAHLGFPLAEVMPDGTATIMKIEGTGGLISRATCTEQLLYEVQDPAAYITPDVIADFSTVQIVQTGPDQVRVSHAGGRARPSQLKVSAGFHHGYMGEGQISYAGHGCVRRAQLAEMIVRERLKAWEICELECSLIGVNAIHGDALAPRPLHEPHEVRLRVAGRAQDRAVAQRIPREVEALYVNGPAGGGGVTGFTREMIAVESLLIPREAITSSVHMETA